jgi:hypothetical protein
VIVGRHAVRCDTCPAQHPGHPQSPGTARRTARQDGWTTLPGTTPGEQGVLDACPDCQTTKET